MKRPLLMLVASALLLFGCGSKKPTSEIDGTWDVFSAEADPKAKEAPPKEKLLRTKFTFAGGKMTMASEDMKTEGDFKIDTSRNPKQILVITGRPAEGIYKLDGTELTLCLGMGKNPKRPTEFSAKPGSGLMLLVLRRE